MASWKKTASILLIVMIILVTGCVKKNNIESPATESATNEVDVSVSTQKVPSKSTPSLAPTESIKSENPTQEPSSVVSTATATPSATQAVVTSNPTLVPSVSPTVTVAPKTTVPTVKPTAKPTVTVKPTAKPTATAKPTPTPTVKPTVAPYDDAKAQYWVDFAEEYAASIGLRVKDAEEYARYTMDIMHIELGKEHITYSLIDGTKYVAIYHTLKDVVRENSSWDDPIAVYAKRIQSYISEDLTGRLDDYKRVGIKGVCIWYEKYDGEFAHCEDEYQIYIAYSGLNEN